MGSGFIDDECASHQWTAIARFNCLVCNGIVVDLDKAKASGLAAEAVAQNVYGIDMNPGFGKEGLDVGFSSFVGQIAYEELRHFTSPHSFGFELILMVPYRTA